LVVDFIAAGGPLAIRAAQQATKTIPIVALTDDMVGAGLVSSMARPNGNTTGVSILATELDGKRQEILAEAVPGLRRMAILADSTATAAPELDALQAASRARNIELSIQRIARGEEIAEAINLAKASGAAALNVLASPMPKWLPRHVQPSPGSASQEHAKTPKGKLDHRSSHCQCNSAEGSCATRATPEAGPASKVAKIKWSPLPLTA
jgi:ABC transporter substrate binding protein